MRLPVGHEGMMVKRRESAREAALRYERAHRVTPMVRASTCHASESPGATEVGSQANVHAVGLKPEMSYLEPTPGGGVSARIA